MMCARAIFTLAAFAAVTHAQVWVDVSPTYNENENYQEEIENRNTLELIEELQKAKDEALLLYTEYSGRSGGELKVFMRNMSGLADDTIRGMDNWTLENASDDCRTNFEKRLKKTEFDSQKYAGFSGENHHKFMLGHMIVLRIHLNKTDDYIKKCEKELKICGQQCENSPRLLRWQRLAKEELRRIEDDLQHTRTFYKDIVAHGHRRLNHIKKQASAKVQEAIDEFVLCMQKGV